MDMLNKKQDMAIYHAPEGVAIDPIYRDEDLITADRPPEPKIKAEPFDPYDPNAPFYFRKQSHLLWLRVYSRYGSQGWKCEDKKPLEGHIKIGNKYMNKVCVKPVDNKIITIHSQL